MMRPNRLAVVGAWAALIVACGSDGGVTTDGGGGDGGNPLGKDGAVGDGGNQFGDGSINTDSGLWACATDTQKGQVLPLDLYIMQDTSGSMWTQIAQNVSKYAAVKSALTAFVNDPGSAGMGVGLQFFPVNKSGEPASCTASTQCSGGSTDFCLKSICLSPSPKFNSVIPCNVKADCPSGMSCVAIGECTNDPNTLCLPNTACGTDPNGFALGQCSAALSTSTCTQADSCTASDYATPAVPIATLPNAATAFAAALAAKSPNGNTPTSAALQGAIDQAKSYAVANPTHTVVAVFVTDGLPTECDTSITNIAAIAQAGLSGTPSIETFVIGVFATNEQATAKPNLDAIAQAGGTTQAFIVTANSTAEQAFLAAMNQIRTQALPCEFFLPKPDGGTPDYNKLNVVFTAGNQNVTVIPYVGSLANCNPQTGGWYYDVDPNQGTPTKALLCPATCAVVHADVLGRIDIVQGCQTVVPK
ncbi:MAG TPA: VWA domain-containing protein [Polyangiaceae bacterium]|nr:VWA domain-containing protein [Polyangiaceae bacterium]